MAVRDNLNKVGGVKVKTVEVPASSSYGEGSSVTKYFNLSGYGNVLGIVKIKGTIQANAYYLSSTNLDSNGTFAMNWGRHSNNTGSNFGHNGLTILVEDK